MPSKSRSQKYADRASIESLGLIKNFGKIKSRLRSSSRRFDYQECELRILEKAKAIPHQYEFLISWETRYIGLSGGYGCLDGETLIDVLQDGKPARMKIKDLCGSTFYVKTMFGYSLAQPAYQKGFASLYRVTLENGRQFLATKDHRCLSPSGWVQVGHLVEGSQVAVDGIADDLSCSQKSIDSQSFDRRDFRSCDEPRRPEEVFYQELIQQFDGTSILADHDFERFLPALGLEFLSEGCDRLAERRDFSTLRETAKSLSLFSLGLRTFLKQREQKDFALGSPQSGLPQHTSILQVQFSQQTDADASLAQGLSTKHCTSLIDKRWNIPLHEDARFLPFSPVKAHPNLSVFRSHQGHEASCSPSLESSELLWQFVESFSPQSEKVQSSVFEPLSASTFINLKGFPEHSWSRVKAIEFVKKDFFYDFHVPIYNHYIAEGVIHHNSGKTFANVCKQLLFAFRSQGCDHLFFEPSIPLLDDIAIPQFNTLLEEFQIPNTFRRTPRPIFTLHLPGGDTRILLRSFENYERIIGINAASCVMDEIDTVKASIVEKAIVNIQGRARVGKCKQQFAFGSTPEGFNFLYSFFMLGTNQSEADIQVRNDAECIIGEDRKLVFGDSEKNKFVRRDYIDDLYAQYPPNIARAYIKGKFVNLATVTVFSEYKREEHRSKIFDAEITDTILTGADFNVGNMRFVFAVIRSDPTGQRLHLFKEGKARDTYDYIGQLMKMYPRHIAAAKVVCYPDATGSREYTSSTESDHDIIRQAGVRIIADKKNPPVPSVIAHVNNCFYRNRIAINVEQCPDLTKCCEQWGYGKDLKPEKGGTVDHSNIGDAFKYLVWGSLPRAKRGIASGMRVR